ncbi:tripartite tricarboxylate transporter substrate binding protein [Cupriavidus sp. WKF15]|uniref:Bug family tripartite tricarboxylate transporter substrate binding protein n=1 Tax=Cupriavidus sp. WKF15 TaxID=3032282 RepID=UPI0023E23CB5|nr:tripartite tricarboxylate transporter substrate binding protein [Cupriavidus sp. WKF15]WER47667.1 tripartite tricarboxylate transporter substrate binding protein [Cupriavidus sp. WKF15]
MRTVGLACLGLVVGLSANARAADAYPSKPIRFVVPYPPGGPTDLMARLLQASLQTRLGATVVVENRAGAGGNIGTDAVAKAAPDGYTILLAASGPMAVNPTLYKHLPYDPQKDLAPVVQISAFPLVLEVHPDSPVKDVKSFIASVRSKPGDYSFASAGNGTPQHLAGELFNTAEGTKMQHIAYKGAGPALNDVLGGQVPVMFDIMASSLTYIKAGKLRPLAVTTKVRSPVLPDVPTLAESGLPGFEFVAWHGIAVPAATPRDIVLKLNGAINAAFKDPEFRKRWEAIGTPVVGGTPEAFGALIRSETTRLGKVVRDTGATVD